MRIGRLAMAAIVSAVLAHAASAAGQGNAKAAGALLALPFLAVPLQLLLAGLFPRAVRRLALCLPERVDATLAWGIAVLFLAALVGGVPAGVGGPGGQAFGVLVGLAVLVGAMAGGAGLSLRVGRWSLRRDGVGDGSTFLAVLIGGGLLGIATWVPLLGQLLSLALLVLSLGAVARATVGAPPLEGPLPQPTPAPEAPEATGDAP
jgi:hypothetical protein